MLRNTTRRSAPRSNSGVARETTVVWMVEKCGPGGGRTPTLAKSAPANIAHTGPESAPPTWVRLA